MQKILHFSLFIGLFFLAIASQAQNGTLSGAVKEANGDGMIGATIRIESSSIGTITDGNGNYSISLKPGTYNVTYSYVGYQNKTAIVKIIAGEILKKDIQLEEENNAFDEVIVIGYGSKIKRDVTGSVVKVTGKEITDMPTPSFEAGLQGKAAGVQVTVGSGVAGSASLVRIRGVASISASGDPLYVVDGIPITQNYFISGNSGGFNNNPLATLNPEDIESVDILKDAAATSIYGSRGANGGILITTKRANKKGLSFDFTSRIGTSQATYKPQMMNSKQFLQMYQEAWENDGHTGRAPLPNNISWEEAEKTNTNWIDETMGVGFKQMYTLGTSYRKEKFGIYAGLSYDNNGSFVIGSKYERLSARLNVDYKPIKKLDINLSSSLSNGKNQRVDAAWSGGFGAAMSTALPIYPIKDSTGNYWNASNGSINAVSSRNLKQWRTTENRTINNLRATYNISKLWTVTGSGSIDYMGFAEDIYEPKALINTDHAGIAKRSPRETFNYNYNLVTNFQVFKDTFNTIDMMVGTEYQRSIGHSRYIEITDVTDPLFTSTERGTNSTQKKITDPIQEFAFNSYFTRIDYKLKNKYLFQLTMRTDGSSRFGPNNAYGFFPAASGAWVISDEKFMKRLPQFNMLKLKAGYGRTGNSPSANYAWRGTFTPSTNSTQYNGQPTIYPTKLENPDLKWETSDILDVSIEGGVYHNRITFELAYYYKKTSGVILDLAIPKSIGFGSYYDNVGNISNKGIEFSITSRNIAKKYFTWTTNFNIARNYNKILDIGIYTQDAVSGGTNDTRVVVGEPVGTNYLVRFSHIDANNGKPVYLDKNGKETYTWTNDDRVAVGSVLPKAVGGITNTFTYKGWNLNLLFVYKIGGNIYNSSAKRQNGVVTDWNMTTDYLDHWRQPGDDAKYPKLSMETSEYGLPSDPYQYNTTLFLENGSYLRMRNVAIGYNLPSKWFNNKVRTFKVILTGTNLLTFTPYTGGDPEIARDFENPADRNMSSNITYLTAPQEKSYSLTLNLTF
jgi:TonB-dependent starch-binding outer membrane protein SusC